MGGCPSMSHQSSKMYRCFSWKNTWLKVRKGFPWSTGRWAVPFSSGIWEVCESSLPKQACQLWEVNPTQDENHSNSTKTKIIQISLGGWWLRWQKYLDEVGLSGSGKAQGLREVSAKSHTPMLPTREQEKVVVVEEAIKQPINEPGDEQRDEHELKGHTTPEDEQTEQKQPQPHVIAQ